MPRKPTSSASHPTPATPGTSDAMLLPSHPPDADTSLLSVATDASTTTVKTPKSTSKPEKDSDTLGIDDLLLPRTLTSRLARGTLPPNTSLQRDALLALTKAASVFISYLASHANEITTKKTIMSQDVLQAVREVELGGVMGLDTIGKDGLPGGRLEREVEMWEGVVRGKRRGYRDKLKEKEREKERESGVGIELEEDEEREAKRQRMDMELEVTAGLNGLAGKSGAAKTNSGPAIGASSVAGPTGWQTDHSAFPLAQIQPPHQAPQAQHSTHSAGKLHKPVPNQPTLDDDDETQPDEDAEDANDDADDDEEGTVENDEEEDEDDEESDEEDDDESGVRNETDEDRYGPGAQLRHDMNGHGDDDRSEDSE